MRAVYAEHGRLAIKEVPEPVAGPGQLLVAVRAAGLNAADAFLINGSHVSGASTRAPAQIAPSSMPMGAEAAGEVVALGEGVEGFAVGDRVMGVCGGAFAEYATIGAALATPVPDVLTWPEAAAVPVVFATAHDALLTAGRFAAGEHVLVAGASSGVGVAALQMARLFGAGTIAASSRSMGKLDALHAAGIPWTTGLVADDELVEEGMRATGDHGFDVVIDCVGASALARHVAVAALLGRIVSVGRMGGRIGELNLDEVARKRLSIVGVTFRTRSPQEIADVHRRAAADFSPALADGRLRVVLDRVFPFDDVVAAEQWMQTGRQIGKVVLELG